MAETLPSGFDFLANLADASQPEYPIEAIEQAIKQFYGRPLPAPAPKPGFLDRFAAGLAEMPSPGPYGRSGDVFGANLVSGAARAFGGARMGERQRRDQERQQGQQRQDLQAQMLLQSKIEAAKSGYQQRLLTFKEAAKALREAKSEWTKNDPEQLEARAHAEEKGKRRAAVQYPDPVKPAAMQLKEVQQPDGTVIYMREEDAVGKQAPKKAADAAKMPGGGERQRIADQLAAIQQADRFAALYDRRFVGPVSGRLGRVRSATGVMLSEQEANFRASLAQYRNAVISALAGANVPQQEQARMFQQVPVESDPPVAFEAKMRQTRANLSAIAQAHRNTMTETGVDLSGLSPLPADKSGRPPLDSFWRP